MINCNRILSNQLEIIYRLMLKRMAKGITAEQLSAMIGQEPDFITQVEMMKISLDHDTELLEVARALGEENTDSFLFGKTAVIALNVEMEKVIFHNVCHHTCIISEEGASKSPFFLLTEELNNNILSIKQAS